MKSTILAVLVAILSSGAAFSQAQEQGQDKIAAVSTVKAPYQAAKDAKPASEPKVGTDGGTPVNPTNTRTEGPSHRTLSAHAENNLFKVNYRTLKRGQDHDLTLKDGTKTGMAKWNDNGTFTIYDTEMNLLGTVMYVKRGGRFQVFSDEGKLVKDSGSRGEKIVTYMVLLGIGIGVSVAATGT